jgi:hypothetical protein
MCFDLNNVEFDGAHIARYDKVHRTSGMSHIDYGPRAFHRSVFASIPTGEKRDLASVYQDLLKAGKLAAY